MDRKLNGEPIQYPCRASNWDGCCDCGLVHLVFYEDEKKDVVTQKNYRDDYYTLQRRLKKSMLEWRYLFEVLEDMFEKKGYSFEYTLKRRVDKAEVRKK